MFLSPPGHLGRWPTWGLPQFVSLEQKLEPDLKGLFDEISLGNWGVSVETLGLAEPAFLL